VTAPTGTSTDSPGTPPESASADPVDPQQSAEEAYDPLAPRKSWRERIRLPRYMSGPHPPLTVAARIILTMLGILGGLAVWFVVYSMIFSGLQENRTQAILYAQIREGLAGLSVDPADINPGFVHGVPFGGPILPGTPVAVMTIANAGIENAVVVDGTTSRELTNGPGHEADTPMPGQAGVAVIMGRSVTFGAPFSGIAGLHPGNKISITTGQGTFTYLVYDVRYPGDPLPGLLPSGKGRLVLVTSTSGGWRGGWAPNEVVYVDATLAGATQPTPSGGATAIPTAAMPMQGDPSGLVPLVLWLQALVLISAGVVWGRLRWGPWKTWIVGAPLVLAVLWGVSQTAILLLPNLI
jgi:sortase A